MVPIFRASAELATVFGDADAANELALDDREILPV